MYTIILLSKDGHKLEFRTKDKNRDNAIDKAYEKLKELNYDVYGYSLHQVSEEE